MVGRLIGTGFSLRALKSEDCELNEGCNASGSTPYDMVDCKPHRLKPVPLEPLAKLSQYRKFTRGSVEPSGSFP